MADAEDQALLQQQYQAMRLDANGLASKISELEQDHHEHELVLSAMDGLEPTRKCFRLVGGVLVERTVAEVHPAVTSNKEKIKSVIESLGLQLAEKERIIREFVNMHKLNVGPNMPGNAQQALPERQSQGILAGKA